MESDNDRGPAFYRVIKLRKCKSKPLCYHLRPTRMTVIKHKKLKNVGTYVGKLEPLYIVGGNVRWCTAVTNSLAVP